MVKLTDLLKEIKILRGSTNMVYWPDLLKRLRKEFGRSFKIYNNLNERYPSVKISFYKPGATEPISNVDPEDVHAYLVGLNTQNWKFDLKNDAYGKKTIYAYPLDMLRGDESRGLALWMPDDEAEDVLIPYFSRLKDLNIIFPNREEARKSWRKHFPYSLQETGIIPEIKAVSPNLYNIIARKVNSLDTKIIDNILYVDFDDIGTLWSEVFEETFGRRYDDVEGSNEDHDNFEKIQDISIDLLSNNGEIEVELDY